MRRESCGKIRFHVDFSFLVFNALIFLIKDGGLIFNFYSVCAIHETGHMLAIFLTKGKIKSVCFSGTGIRIVTKKNSTVTLKHELFVLLAGPAANLFIFIMMRCLHCGGAFPIMNLAVAVYNLLPYRQLDGGAAIGLFISGSVWECEAEYFLLAIKIVFSAVILIIYLTLSKAVFSLLIVSVLLLISDLCSFGE